MRVLVQESKAVAGVHSQGGREDRGAEIDPKRNLEGASMRAESGPPPAGRKGQEAGEQKAPGDVRARDGQRDQQAEEAKGGADRPPRIFLHNGVV